MHLVAGFAGSMCGLFGANSAWADEPITLRQTWSGPVDFFATGAPLAVDGPDSGTNVDLYNQPATASVDAAQIPFGAGLADGFLYWVGSVSNNDCADASNLDADVLFTPPGGSQVTVVADECFCSAAGAVSYDIQMCRANVTSLIGSIAGDYTVDGFDALIANGSTNNASFSVVLVFVADGLSPRRIGLYDGVQTMYTSTQTLTLDELEVDNPPAANLTWYVAEGDEGGSGTEQVQVQGNPSGGSLIVSDGLNPAGNPMNHTINTTTPMQSDSIGVDIDQFDISAALAFGDTSVDVTYQAGTDKWWIAYNIVGIDVYEPVFSSASYKNSSIVDDINNDGFVSPGDTVRYAVRLANTGTAPGVVTMTDMVPAQATSWAVVDLAGGVDASTVDTVIVQDIPVAAGSFAEVLFDVVIADVTDQTPMANTASFDASPEGDLGSVTAAPVLIRVDGDDDGVFDNDDNCVVDFNPTQADEDFDFIGDACDPDFGGSDTGTTGDSMGTGTGSDGGTTDAETGAETTGSETDAGSATVGADESGTGDGASADATASGAESGGTDGGSDEMAASVGADASADGGSSTSGDGFGFADGSVDGCTCTLARREAPLSSSIALFALLPLIRRRRRRR